MHEFKEWPKTPRLFRDIVVTEKIDGTNSAVHISRGYEVTYPSFFQLKPGEAIVDGHLWHISAQSRKRIITPGKTTDNHGFASWVYDNAADLVTLLGEGLHYGEWWGQGIQRRYNLDEKRFSLFNTERHGFVDDRIGGTLVRPVPKLYEGAFSESAITGALMDLQTYGSVAAPGFMNPEGVCVYHSQTRSVFKVTIDANDAGKWEVAA